MMMRMENNGRPLVSIYTCVYNMSDKIHRVFSSLKQIDYSNIEHIIIDDGSTDCLDEIVNKYIEEVNYPVVYHKKPNGGKHTALNIAWSLANGVFAIKCDADDELLPNSISYLVDQWFNIPVQERNKYWCVHGRCKTQFGEFVGDLYPKGINELPYTEAKNIAHSVKGEKIGLQRVDILKQYRFPEPELVKMVTESVIWNQINKCYRTWYTNEVVRVYYVNEGGNLSAVATKKQHFINRAWYNGYHIQHRDEYPLEKPIKKMVVYSLCYQLAGEEYQKKYSYTKDFLQRDKPLLIILRPIGNIAALVYRIRYGIRKIAD